MITGVSHDQYDFISLEIYVYNTKKCQGKQEENITNNTFARYIPYSTHSDMTVKYVQSFL